MNFRGITDEFKRRKTYRVILFSALIVWGLLAFIHHLKAEYSLQDEIASPLIILIFGASIVAIILAWINDYSPGGYQIVKKRRADYSTVKANSEKKYLTFFFSDIENSTRLVINHSDHYAETLNTHRQIIRASLKNHNGREIDTAGDGFFITFTEAVNAARCAAEVQEQISKYKWPDGIKLKLRIGLHTGFATVTHSGCIGLEVHRASRICNSAFGGQVLLSTITRDKIKNNLPEPYSLKNLGSYVLKDFYEPQDLFQLKIPGVNYGDINQIGKRELTHVAVLPFLNFSDDESLDFFCDGMAEELIVALGMIPEIRVLSRSTIYSLQKIRLDPSEYSKRLGADVLVNGSVRKLGDKMRIMVELVDTKTGVNIWSSRFDKISRDVFELQEEISSSIAEALAVQLVPGRQANEQTRNIEAYEFYIKGRRHYFQFSRSSVEKAREMFHKAIDLDPKYALAYAGLSDCFSYLYGMFQRTEENLSQAMNASKRANELAPGLAEAYTSRGQALSLSEEYELAEEKFEKALEINPKSFDGWYQYGRMHFAQGNLAKAARLFEHANEVRMDDYQSILLAGQIYHDLGHFKLASIYREKGIGITENILQITPENTRALYMNSNALVTTGHPEDGLRQIRKALKIEPDDPMLLYNAGCIFSILKMKDEAFKVLEKAIAGGLSQIGWFHFDSNLDNLRDDPRFAYLLKLISIP